VVLSLPVGDESKKVCHNMPKAGLAYRQLEPSLTTNSYTHPQVEEVRVDMAAMKVESKQVELLTSVGSCVAICLYDFQHKCGGLAHIMLPHSNLGTQEPLPSKFADTAVPTLAKAIRQISGKESRLTAKISGGANMFASLGINRLDIGTKNIKATKAALDECNIRLLSEDVGGFNGRRITFNPTSGTVSVRHFNGDVRTL
jgi:chemotaxis protein CheD